VPAEQGLKPIAGPQSRCRRAERQFLGLHTSYNGGAPGFVTKNLPDFRYYGRHAHTK
jgi:hypothetical protein